MSVASYIYLVEQGYRRGYDTYDSFVVICDSEDEARNTNPCRFSDDNWSDVRSWCPRNLVDKEVKVTKIGVTHKQDKEIVCRSFNAG